MTCVGLDWYSFMQYLLSTPYVEGPLLGERTKRTQKHFVVEFPF